MLMALYSGISPFKIPEFVGMEIEEVEECTTVDGVRCPRTVGHDGRSNWRPRPLDRKRRNAHSNDMTPSMTVVSVSITGIAQYLTYIVMGGPDSHRFGTACADERSGDRTVRVVRGRAAHETATRLSDGDEASYRSAVRLYRRGLRHGRLGTGSNFSKSSRSGIRTCRLSCSPEGGPKR